jgi:hypothetical protein
MAVNAPKPTRRKPVSAPVMNDTRDNLQSVDPNGYFKFTMRMPMEMAIEFKTEAAKRMISLQDLFQLSFEAFKEKNGIA